MFKKGYQQNKLVFLIVLALLIASSSSLAQMGGNEGGRCVDNYLYSCGQCGTIDCYGYCNEGFCPEPEPEVEEEVIEYACSETYKGCFNDADLRVTSVSPGNFYYFCEYVADGEQKLYFDPDQISKACNCIVGADYDDRLKKENNCCGDDIADCGFVDEVLVFDQTIDKTICSLDANFQGGQWISAEDNRGDIFPMRCNGRDYLSIETTWVPCLKRGAMLFDDSTYVCDEDEEQWHACCGTETCGASRQLLLGQSLIVPGSVGNAGCNPQYPYGQKSFPNCGIKDGFTAETNCGPDIVNKTSVHNNGKCQPQYFGPYDMKYQSEPVFFDVSLSSFTNECKSKNQNYVLHNYTVKYVTSQDAWYFDSRTGWDKTTTTMIVDNIYCVNPNNWGWDFR